MTVRKTEDELRGDAPKSGPEVINVGSADAEKVQALKVRYPNAKNIEKLPSGLFAVRFHKKRAKYVKGSR